MWRDGESKPLADFGRQDGSENCDRLDAPDVDMIEDVRCGLSRPDRMSGTRDRTGSTENIEGSRDLMRTDMEGYSDVIAGVPFSMKLDNLCFD
jgi:hypothetical protein